MRLLLDFGNTRVKWRIESFESRVPLSGVAAHDNVDDLMSQWSSFLGLLNQVVITSVASKARVDGVLRIIRSRWPLAQVSYAVNSRNMVNVQLCYEDVERLGVDRALAMVAAYDKARAACLVIDGGSALTADYVSESGEHLGGYIVPGLAMLADALTRQTDKIWFEHDVPRGSGLGTSTESCVQYGVNRMFEATLRDFALKAEELGVKRMFITGGNAEDIAAVLPGACHEPNLVLDGLALWADQLQDSMNA